MHTLVTGGTGLVGNNIVRMLVDRGERVRVLARPGSNPRPFVGLAVEIVYGDTCDSESVDRACREAVVVIHCAAAVRMGRGNLARLRKINVEGTRNVAVAARDAGARMVHVSSADAAGIASLSEEADEETDLPDCTPLPYVVTKREAEQVIYEQTAKGLFASIVNPGFMFGPWDWKPSSGRMLLQVARGRGPLAPRGRFSVGDVRDVAAAILTCAERGECSRRYLLTGETLSYLDAWRLIAEVTGARRPMGELRPLLTKIVGCGGDLFGAITGSQPEVNSAALAWAALPKNYSCARACAELDYRQRPVRQSIEDAWDWFREYSYV